MKYKLYTCFLLWVGFGMLHAQQVVVLDSFNVFERTKDTLYFNRQGYDAVQVSTPLFNPKGYKTRFYVLKNDHTSLDFLREKSGDLDKAIKKTQGYKSFFIHYSNVTYFEHRGLYMDKSVYLRKPFPQVAAGWDKKAYLDTLHYKPATNTGAGYFVLDEDELPEETGIIQSIAQKLNYEGEQGYRITVDVTEEGYPYAYIEPDNLCGNFDLTQMGDINIKSLEDSIARIKWPVLKIHTKKTAYRMVYAFSYYDIVDMWIRKERKNHYSGSVKLFSDDTTAYAIEDKFNKKIIFYRLNYYENSRYMTIDKTFLDTLFDVAAQPRFDVDNDGLPDLVIDTVASSSVEDGLGRRIPAGFSHPEKTIRYMGHNKSASGYYRYRGRYYSDGYYERNNALSMMSYMYSLGNYYYYKAYTSGNTESAEIYQVVDGHEFSLVYYQRRMDSYSPVQDQLKNNEVKYTLWVTKNGKTKMTRASNPRKGLAMKTEAVQLIGHLLAHPEELPAMNIKKQAKQ